uniref:SET domain-containing protein n=1 Tax=Romanomermis culicivorax TaxID=13658 RepID=A0A915JHB8_ROMCU
MKYVRISNNERMQNLVACQVGRQIYFYSIKSIPADTELVVWYSRDYQAKLIRHCAPSDEHFSQYLKLMEKKIHQQLITAVCDSYSPGPMSTSSAASCSAASSAQLSPPNSHKTCHSDDGYHSHEQPSVSPPSTSAFDSNRNDHAVKNYSSEHLESSSDEAIDFSTKSSKYRRKLSSVEKSSMIKNDDKIQQNLCSEVEIKRLRMPVETSTATVLEGPIFASDRPGVIKTLSRTCSLKEDNVKHSRPSPILGSNATPPPPLISHRAVNFFNAPSTAVSPFHPFTSDAHGSKIFSTTTPNNVPLLMPNRQSTPLDFLLTSGGGGSPCPASSTTFHHASVPYLSPISNCYSPLLSVLHQKHFPAVAPRGCTSPFLYAKFGAQGPISPMGAMNAI